MKTVCFSLVLLVMVGWAAQARTQARIDEFPAADLPREGKSLQDFVPIGWTVQEQATGDLNGDGIPDVAAILIESESPDTHERALVVLLGREGGKFTLAGTNGKLVQCKECGGMKESEGIAIKKGVIIVDQMMGSREYAVYTWRFRYDPQTQRFVMIGMDLESADGGRGTGTIESSNYLTGQKITTTYRYDKKGENKITTSTKKDTIPKKTPFFEDVEGDY